MAATVYETSALECVFRQFKRIRGASPLQSRGDDTERAKSTEHNVVNLFFRVSHFKVVGFIFDAHLGSRPGQILVGGRACCI